jgi:hypothetical protein
MGRRIFFGLSNQGASMRLLRENELYGFTVKIDGVPRKFVLTLVKQGSRENPGRGVAACYAHQGSQVSLVFTEEQYRTFEQFRQAHGDFFIAAYGETACQKYLEENELLWIIPSLREQLSLDNSDLIKAGLQMLADSLSGQSLKDETFNSMRLSEMQKLTKELREAIPAVTVIHEDPAVAFEIRRSEPQLNDPQEGMISFTFKHIKRFKKTGDIVPIVTESLTDFNGVPTKIGYATLGNRAATIIRLFKEKQAELQAKVQATLSTYQQ